MQLKSRFILIFIILLTTVINNAKNIFLLTGSSCSGKSTLVTAMRNGLFKGDCGIVHFDTLFEEYITQLAISLKILPVDYVCNNRFLTQRTIQQYFTNNRDDSETAIKKGVFSEGLDRLIYKVIAATNVALQQYENVIIDSLLFKPLIDIFKEHFPRVTTIFLYTSFDELLSRLECRNQQDNQHEHRFLDVILRSYCEIYAPCPPEKSILFFQTPKVVNALRNNKYLFLLSDIDKIVQQFFQHFNITSNEQSVYIKPIVDADLYLFIKHNMIEEALDQIRVIQAVAV